MLFSLITEDTTAYNVGYAIGKNLPYAIILILAFIILRYFRKKSKK